MRVDARPIAREGRRSMRTTRATINDVARAAGVSKATVSAVLNDKATVKESTRAEVLEAMRTLSYRPNPAARRRLTNGRRRTVGFLLREIANPYYAEIITGAEEYLSEHGYTILSAASGGNFGTEKQIVEAFTQKDVDGLLLTPVLNNETDLAHIFDLKRHNVSFVLLEAIHGIQANLVDVDTVEGAKGAVRHLIDLGHTRIAHFAGPQYSLHSDERISGVRAAYSESRLIFSEAVVVRAGDSLINGYRAGLEFFRDCPADRRPTAVTCYNDLVALGVCRALAELGLRVPDDVSVVGYDDLQLLDYVFPRLTSVRVPKHEVGRRAAEILHREIGGASRTPQKVYLKTELVIRESTAPPHEPA
jgi:LacI family transcriptional regulator/LacI family repressor for deo operon, udp, cdd, tsx, nupC, and nupG